MVEALLRAPARRRTSSGRAAREAEWVCPSTEESLADYRKRIDNLRGALDLAFSPGGDA